MYERGVVLIYHDINFDLRSQEYLQLAEKMCDKVTIVCINPLTFPCRAEVISIKPRKTKYMSFILEGKKVLKKIKPDIVFLHDSESTVLTKYIRRYCPKAKIILDSSELYYDQKATTIKAAIVSPLRGGSQSKYIATYDVVIAACLERAELMKEHYDLNEVPIVFDNVHRIDGNYDLGECESKFSSYIEKNKCNILYAGGVSKERRTFELAQIVANNPCKYNLLICSGIPVSKENMDILRKSMVNGNVHFLGRLSRVELKYLLENVQISVSMFEKNCLNNIYCASGKVYESLFCGVPVLLSDNPPLKRLCKEHQVGVSTDDLAAGLEELSADIDKFRSNIKSYIISIDYDNRVDTLCKAVEERLK